MWIKQQNHNAAQCISSNFQEIYLNSGQNQPPSVLRIRGGSSPIEIITDSVTKLGFGKRKERQWSKNSGNTRPHIVSDPFPVGLPSDFPAHSQEIAQRVPNVRLAADSVALPETFTVLPPCPSRVPDADADRPLASKIR